MKKFIKVFLLLIFAAVFAAGGFCETGIQNGEALKTFAEEPFSVDGRYCGIPGLIITEKDSRGDSARECAAYESCKEWLKDTQGQWYSGGKYYSVRFEGYSASRNQYEICKAYAFWGNSNAEERIRSLYTSQCVNQKTYENIWGDSRQMYISHEGCRLSDMEIEIGDSASCKEWERGRTFYVIYNKAVSNSTGPPVFGTGRERQGNHSA